MDGRATRASALRRLVLPALVRGGYHYRKRLPIGVLPGGGDHVVDVFAWDQTGMVFLISLKWQQVRRSTEEKVVFYAICLAQGVLTLEVGGGNVLCKQCGEALPALTATPGVTAGDRMRAYLVLGGGGWALRDFFVGEGMRKHLRYHNLVAITSLQDFISLAHKGEL